MSSACRLDLAHTADANRPVNGVSVAESGDYQHLLVEQDSGVARVTLNRPEVRNAFNAALIAELDRCFRALSADAAVRVVVLTGAGAGFSAGADLNWMEQSITFPPEQNMQEALVLAGMLESIDGCMKPVVGRINGHAMGGGVGLVACCDVVVAVETARFDFTEVRLGMTPATISPFVIRKIGASHARALFATAERFDAFRAKEIGLVHEVATEQDLDVNVQQKVDAILRGGPVAQAAAKRLIADVLVRTPAEQKTYTAAMIAALRTSPEGQEGAKAFLGRRPAAWTPEAHAPTPSAGAPPSVTSA